MDESNPISISVEKIRMESTSSRSTVNNHDLVTFDDVLAKDDLRRSTIQRTRSRTRTHSSASNKSAKKAPAVEKKRMIMASADQRSLYERIIGKTPLTTAPMKPAPSQPIKNTIFGWFTKETAEERAIKSILKSYRSKLQQEVQYTSRAWTKYQKKTIDQIAEYERQERQLISWGLKTAIPKFHLQAWYRIERCRLYEKLSEEIGGVIDGRQRKAQLYLQNFEESSNRKNKFSVSSTEEFCVAPDKLILQDASILALQDRLKRMDILYGIASKQFMQLEPEFEWKDQKDRKKEFYRILYSYNDLPQYSELDNIESELSWKSFCNWIADRMTKQKKIEQDYFDFIEDSREVEGRLFQRWQTCVLLSLTSGGLSSVDRTVSDSSDPQFRDTPATSSAAGDGNEFRSARPAPLKVTPASIRAFIQYFASDIIGVKYTIPRDCIAANKALAEALFYRRIAPYVFRYADAHQRRLDDYWRVQCQRCRFVNPKAYYVMEKFLVKKEKPLSPSASTDASDGATTAAAGALTPPPAPPAPAVTPNTGARPRKGSQSNLHNNAEPHNNNHSKMNSPLPCMCYYCQTLSLSQRLQRLPIYEETMRGEHFARSARVLSWLRSAVTPREMAVYLTLACKWILRDAIDVSGSRSIIGADEMVPLFTMVLVHAQIPNIHMILRILTDFGEYDEQGDISYCIANLEGSMRFLMDFTTEEIPADIHQMFHKTPMYASIVASINGEAASTLGASPLASTPGAAGVSSIQVATPTLGSSIGTNLASAGPSSRTSSPAPTSANAAQVADIVSAAETPLGKASATSGGKTKATEAVLPAGGLFTPQPSTPVPTASTPFAISKPPPQRSTAESSKQEDSEAMEQLGEWLRDQKTMEDTIAILQSDGWML